MGFTSRGIRHPSHGLTVLEIGLSLLLAIVLVLSFFSIRHTKAKKQRVRACTERQWRWIPMVDDLEQRLRHWEMKAPTCLRAGFSPVDTSVPGKTTLHAIEGVRPLLRSMGRPDMAEVPLSHPFSSRNRILLCDETSFRFGAVQQIYPVTASQTASVEIRIEDTNQPALFPQNALMAMVRTSTLESAPSEKPPEQFLTERQGESRRIAAEAYDTFMISVKASETSDETATLLRFAREECALDREIKVLRTPLETGAGDWLFRKSQLFFQSWSEPEVATP